MEAATVLVIRRSGSSCIVVGEFEACSTPRPFLHASPNHLSRATPHSHSSLPEVVYQTVSPVNHVHKSSLCCATPVLSAQHNRSESVPTYLQSEASNRSNGTTSTSQRTSGLGGRFRRRVKSARFGRRALNDMIYLSRFYGYMILALSEGWDSARFFRRPLSNGAKRTTMLERLSDF